MRVTVLLFAVARARAGCDSMTVDVADGATAGDVLAACVAASPALAALAPQLRVAVGQALVTLEAIVPAGAEVALLPPVSGG